MQPFFQSKHITHTVGDKEVKFYPVSIAVTFKLRKFAKQLSRAFAVLMANTDSDLKTKDQVVEDKREDVTQRTFTNEGINPELARIRSDERAEAIEGLIDAFAGPENMAILAEIVMSSMRELYPHGKPPAYDELPKTPEEFCETMPLDAWPELITGMVKANAKVLGPLSKALRRTSDRQAQQEGQETSPSESEIPPPPQS